MYVYLCWIICNVLLCLVMFDFMFIWFLLLLFLMLYSVFLCILNMSPIYQYSSVLFLVLHIIIWCLFSLSWITCNVIYVYSVVLNDVRCTSLRNELCSVLFYNSVFGCGTVPVYVIRNVKRSTTAVPKWCNSLNIMLSTVAFLSEFI